MDAHDDSNNPADDAHAGRGPEDQVVWLPPSTVPGGAKQRPRRILAGSVAAAFLVGGAVGGGTVAIVGSSSGSDTAQGSQGGFGQAPGGSTSGGQGGPGGTTGEGSGPASGSNDTGTGTDTGTGSSVGGDNTAYTGGETTAATAAQAKGVVVIDTVTDDGEDAGTGFVLTTSGEVVTNAHVVEGATTIRVTVATTGTSYTAKVVGSSAKSDIALLQLEGASGLTIATLDDDADLAVGDDVTAVGNAGGENVLVAASGDVEQLDASVTTSASRDEASESLTGLVAIDADVVAGDSGGPLLDADGEVVGIDTAATSGTYDVTGYAIPIQETLTAVHKVLAAVDGS